MDRRFQSSAVLYRGTRTYGDMSPPYFGTKPLKRSILPWKYHKVWVKKTRQLHSFLFHEILIATIKVIKTGLNKMSLALFWCIVCSCRLNMARDMTKNLKSRFFKKCKICNFFAFSFCQNFSSFQLYVWSYLTYINVLYLKLTSNISFWPYFITFVARINFFVR